MTRKKMKLPEGCYPHNPKQVELFIDKIDNTLDIVNDVTVII